MLYEISMFWDGRHTDAKATADGTDDTFWVRVTGPVSAQTTIHVRDRESADKLAALINELIEGSKLKAVA